MGQQRNRPLKDHEWNHRKNGTLSFRNGQNQNNDHIENSLGQQGRGVACQAILDCSDYRHSPDTNGQGRGHKGINKAGIALVARLFLQPGSQTLKTLLNLQEFPDNGPDY